jgi:hypothetical protein
MIFSLNRIENPTPAFEERDGRLNLGYFHAGVKIKQRYRFVNLPG